MKKGLENIIKNRKDIYKDIKYLNKKMHQKNQWLFKKNYKNKTLYRKKINRLKRDYI